MDVRVGLWESLATKNWCFWTVVLEKTSENILNCKEIQPVHPKGNQLWIFIGRTDTEAEAPILWPPYVKNWLIGKDPDAGKDLRWEKKGTTEDEMVGQHHWCNGHEFEQAPVVGDGQGNLMCCSLWGRKESDTTEWLNWTENKIKLVSKSEGKAKKVSEYIDIFTEKIYKYIHNVEEHILVHLWNEITNVN